jgi:hypothetical protein
MTEYQVTLIQNDVIKEAEKIIAERGINVSVWEGDVPDEYIYKARGSKEDLIKLIKILNEIKLYDMPQFLNLETEEWEEVEEAEE